MIGPVSSTSYAVDMARTSSASANIPLPVQSPPVVAQETLASEGTPVENVDTRLQYFALNASLDMNKTLAAQVVNMVQAISAYTGNAGDAGTGSAISTVA